MNDLHQYLDKRLDRLEQKVDELLKFKWQIIGGSAVVATIVSLVLHMLNK
jgi:hypothetical protein